jgi:hypothetical protein
MGGGGEQVTYTGKVVGWLVDPPWHFFSQATRRGQERICAMSREPGGNSPNRNHCDQRSYIKENNPKNWASKMGPIQVFRGILQRGCAFTSLPTTPYCISGTFVITSQMASPIVAQVAEE